MGSFSHTNPYILNVTQQCRCSYFELGLLVVSLAISKPCRVEVKLQVKIVITNPLPCPSHITESTQLFGTMENSPTEFSVESPTSTNTSGFEHSVEVRIDAKSESGLVDGFPSKNIFSRSRPLHYFHVFSRLTSC